MPLLSTLRRAAASSALALSLLLSAATALAVPHVRGYTRRDGTYVRPHYRSAPGTGSSHSYVPRSLPPRRYSYSPPARTFGSPSTPPASRTLDLSPSSVSHNAPAGGKVVVHGYTRKDGIYVPPHTRNAPGAGSSRSGTTTRKTWGAVHLDAGTDLSRWAASHSVRHPAVRLPTFRYNAATSNRKAREYLQRSDAARRHFMRQTGYPHGRPGYIIDHVIPLACGGPDEPSNMQWQTIAEAKAKDRIERRACS